MDLRASRMQGCVLFIARYSNNLQADISLKTLLALLGVTLKLHPTLPHSHRVQIAAWPFYSFELKFHFVIHVLLIKIFMFLRCYIKTFNMFLMPYGGSLLN